MGLIVFFLGGFIAMIIILCGYTWWGLRDDRQWKRATRTARWETQTIVKGNGVALVAVHRVARRNGQERVIQQDDPVEVTINSPELLEAQMQAEYRVAEYNCFINEKT